MKQPTNHNIRKLMRIHNELDSYAITTELIRNIDGLTYGQSDTVRQRIENIVTGLQDTIEYAKEKKEENKKRQQQQKKKEVEQAIQAAEYFIQRQQEKEEECTRHKNKAVHEQQEQQREEYQQLKRELNNHRYKIKKIGTNQYEVRDTNELYTKLYEGTKYVLTPKATQLLDEYGLEPEYIKLERDNEERFNTYFIYRNKTER